MPLFNDWAISTLEELRGYESAIYDLASTERIDLSQKLVLAQQEIEVDLTASFFRETPQEVRKVVVTPALRLWHTFHTLALVYRDAYNSQLNDRYLGKWREYERLTKWAYEKLLVMGVGMTGCPVPKANPPNLTTAPGAATAATYWVRAAWVGVNGEEGCPSDPAVVEASEGMVPVAESSGPPADVTSWNVYAGMSPEAAQLQNAEPLPLGSSWTMPPTGLVAGRPVGTGQAPSTYLRSERLFRRG